MSRRMGRTSLSTIATESGMNFDLKASDIADVGGFLFGGKLDKGFPRERSPAPSLFVKERYLTCREAL